MGRGWPSLGRESFTQGPGWDSGRNKNPRGPHSSHGQDRSRIRVCPAGRGNWGVALLKPPSPPSRNQSGYMGSQPTRETGSGVSGGGASREQSGGSGEEEAKSDETEPDKPEAPAPAALTASPSEDAAGGTGPCGNLTRAERRGHTYSVGTWRPRVCRECRSHWRPPAHRALQALGRCPASWEEEVFGAPAALGFFWSCEPGAQARARVGVERVRRVSFREGTTLALAGTGLWPEMGHLVVRNLHPRKLVGSYRGTK